MANHDKQATQKTDDARPPSAIAAAALLSAAALVNPAKLTGPAPPLEVMAGTLHVLVADPLEPVAECLMDIVAALDANAPGKLFGIADSLENVIIIAGDADAANRAREWCEDVVDRHVPDIFKESLREALVDACTLRVEGTPLHERAAGIVTLPPDEQEKALADLVEKIFLFGIDEGKEMGQEFGMITDAINKTRPLGIDDKTLIKMLEKKRRDAEHDGYELWDRMCDGDCDGPITMKELIACLKWIAKSEQGKFGNKPCFSVHQVFTAKARAATNPMRAMRTKKIPSLPEETVAGAMRGLLRRQPGVKFFVTEDNLRFLLVDGRVLEISDNPRFVSWLAEQSGLTMESAYARTAVRQFQVYADNHGIYRNASPSWTCFQPELQALYIHPHLPDSDVILRITEGGVEHVENGVDDVILARAPGGEVKPFHYTKQDDAGRSEAATILKKHFLDRMACKDSSKHFMLCYPVAALLRDKVTMRPILNVTGATNSGKTSGAKRMTVLLYGKEMAVETTTAAAYSTSARRVLFVLDNKETESLSDADKQFLIIVATGAVREKRMRNTESEVTREKPNCMVVTTAIDPQGLSEIRNRMVAVKMDTEFWQKDKAGTPRQDDEDEAYGALADARDAVLSYLVDVVAERVLPRMQQEYRTERAKIHELSSRLGTHVRCIDYMALMAMVLRALSPELGYNPDTVLKEWVEDQSAGVRHDQIGGSPIIHMLNTLLTCFRSDEDREISMVRAYGIQALTSSTKPNSPTRYDILDGTPGQFLNAARKLIPGFQPGWTPETLAARLRNEDAQGNLTAAGWEWEGSKHTEAGNRHRLKRIGEVPTATTTLATQDAEGGPDPDYK